MSSETSTSVKTKSYEGDLGLLEIMFSLDGTEILTDARGLRLLVNACEEAINCGHADFPLGSDYNTIRLVDHISPSDREFISSGLITVALSITLLIVAAAGLFQIATWLS